MLTLDQFDRWLYTAPNNENEKAITLCHGATAAYFAQLNPDFAQTYQRVKHAEMCGFVYLENEASNHCIVHKQITPKRR
jgi:hypothetical protein